MLWIGQTYGVARRAFSDDGCVVGLKRQADPVTRVDATTTSAPDLMHVAREHLVLGTTRAAASDASIC